MSLNSPRLLALALVASLATFGGATRAQAGPGQQPAPQPAAAVPPPGGGLPNAEDIQGDRPDLSNGTHIVDPGIAQLELGFQHGVEGTAHTTGTPVTVRIGLNDWLEARVGGDGFLLQADQGISVSGPGNVQLAAKIRLFPERESATTFALIPTVNLPVASADKGLGSGDADYTLTMIVGQDLGDQAHVDFNYQVGAIGAGGGDPRFTQHLFTASASYNLTPKLSPWVEGFWYSKVDPDGDQAFSIDAGAIYAISPRLAIDAGIQGGITAAATDVSVFAGVSVMLGDVLGSHGVHARQRRAEKRAARRGK